MSICRLSCGDLGSTQVKIWIYLNAEPALVETFDWDGIVPGGRNPYTVMIPAVGLMEARP
jgi:hypothetical protein